MILNGKILAVVGGLLALSCMHTNYPDKMDLVLNTEVHKDSLPAPYVTEFDRYVRNNVNDSLTPGAAVAIIKDGQIYLCKGYGVKQTHSVDSVNEHTVFRIASVSKGFASVLTGTLVQEGLLSWDDKVVKYLPDFKLHDKKNTENLTIRHILSQSTGLPGHTFTNMIEAGVPFANLRKKLSEVTPIAPVGTVYTYQNVIYSVIADILEKATGKTYETLLKEKLFIPLGLNDASASFEGFQNSGNHAYPHVRTWGGLKETKTTSEYYSVLPAAGVNASISDMAQWLKALMGYRQDVLHQDILKEVTTPQVVATKRRSSHFAKWVKVQGTFYGLGWRIINFGNDTLVYHGGFINGFRSEVAFDPIDKVGVVILSNGPGAFVNEAIPYFFNLFYENRDKEALKHTAGTSTANHFARH
ncbi:MAG TPA: serine hydrolase domain-containing protein [Bacteroidales bacterium]|nr:serine hydrolase domain-containing protein [Bacteroidales bacterium]